MNVTCVVDCRNTLGEGCAWDPRDASLYWTDIEESRIYRLASDQSVSVFPLPERASFVLPRTRPGFVVGFASHVALADTGFQRFTRLHTIEAHLPQTRVNDAAVDPFGGVVFGTFDERDRQPVASLYRLAPNGELLRLFGGVTVSNGIAFCPDSTTMYFADTAVGIVRRFRINPDFSPIVEIDPLAGSEVAPGSPDGAVVDQEGHYWNARVWGSCLVRIGPDGRVSQRIDLPTKGPTCVALGGSSGKSLFATTLRVRHTNEELSAAPQAGGLFCSDVAVPGNPVRLCLL